MTEPATITYLEMTSPDQLAGKYLPADELDVRRVEEPLPALNRFFYEQVGGPWGWKQRLVWKDKQWADYVCRDEMRTYVGYHKGTPVGYFELDKQGDDVEIVYFGLLPQFISRGFGGPLLTRAVETAWAWTAQRVWVHTSAKDHPAALSNYQARGFQIFDQQHL